MIAKEQLDRLTKASQSLSKEDRASYAQGLAHGIQMGVTIATDAIQKLSPDLQRWATRASEDVYGAIIKDQQDQL